jgi:hypothetical protein
MTDASMPDPVPENIDGSKAVTYSHEVHHQINWGYVAVGLAVIAALLFLRERLDGDEESAGEMSR